MMKKSTLKKRGNKKQKKIQNQLNDWDKYVAKSRAIATRDFQWADKYKRRINRYADKHPGGEGIKNEKQAQRFLDDMRKYQAYKYAGEEFMKKADLFDSAAKKLSKEMQEKGYKVKETSTYRDGRNFVEAYLGGPGSVAFGIASGAVDEGTYYKVKI